MSELYEIADAVKTRLNGANLGFANAERLYIPLLELDEIEDDDLHVSVLIAGDDLTPLSRDEQLEEITILVAVLQKIPPATEPTSQADNALIDPMLMLCRKIALLYHPGDTAADGQWLKTSATPAYDRARLREKRTFFAVISYTFQQAP